MPNDLSLSSPADQSLSLDNPDFYINRELSHLQFNQRVLAQALDDVHRLSSAPIWMNSSKSGSPG